MIARALGKVALATTTLALLATALVSPLPAVAAPAPIQPAPSTAISADELPTVQIDGVVWSQAVVGNVVYAGGQFNNARPAGAAPGTQLTQRRNLLAYDITTGNLITSFAPNLDGQVRGVAAAPDGSRIYVVGDFSTANGQPRRRIAAYSTATGQLLPWAPSGPNSLARAVVATSTGVYVGGSFAGLQNGTLRQNLVGYDATTAATLPWSPSANRQVWAIAASADGQHVFAGGMFETVSGQSAYGLAKIAAAGTGALDASWNPSVNNGGADAGIGSLKVQNGFVYGTAWHFGPGGNLEGVFKIPVGNSDVSWVTDCHGDNYSSFLQNGIVYSAGHAHFCGNMSGGFPQYASWRYQHAQAWSDTTTGDILRDVHGYPSWNGVEPGPAMVHWNPEMAMGSFTGQYQAGWDVTGNDDYVVYGGEFPRVNGVNQQGLVRFARRAIAPKQEGPLFVNGTVTPRLVAVSSTALRVSWPAGYDRDSYNLTYQVIRNGAFGSPRHTTSANSNWWTLPALGFVDTGLTPGAAYSYQVVVRDSDGNTVTGGSASVTMPSSNTASNSYAQTVRANGARIYWPLNETSGTRANDRAAGPSSAAGVGVTDGRTDNGVTWGQAGAVSGDSAAALGNNDWARIFTGDCPTNAGCNYGTETSPDTFSAQLWFRTGSTSGGRLLGFSDLQYLNSGHRDRHLYLGNNGRLNFGVRAPNGTASVITSPAAYNDNQWYLATATLSSAGMRLYVNGSLVASNNAVTQGERYVGYWRVGGDNLDGWANQPSSRNPVASVDEVAIYPSALSQSQIQALYDARNGGGGGNQPPTASFTAAASGLTTSVDAGASDDPDGTIASYAWNFGDGSTGSGVTTSRTYASAGTYTVTLTVTDNQGATATTTRQVTVSQPNPGQVVADGFGRTVSNGWGSADTGGAYTLGTAASNFAVADGVGTMSMNAGSGPAAYLNGVSARDVDLTTTLSFTKPATGGGIYTSAVVRRIGTSDYRLKLQIGASATTAHLTRTVNGAETTLASQAIGGLTMAAGDVLNVRFQAQGSGPTTLRGKLWRAGTAEPGSWQVTATDSTAALQAPGGVGLTSYLSGSASNAPIVLRVDALAVANL